MVYEDIRMSSRVAESKRSSPATSSRSLKMPPAQKKHTVSSHSHSSHSSHSTEQAYPTSGGLQKESFSGPQQDSFSLSAKPSGLAVEIPNTDSPRSESDYLAGLDSPNVRLGQLSTPLSLASVAFGAGRAAWNLLSVYDKTELQDVSHSSRSFSSKGRRDQSGQFVRDIGVDVHSMGSRSRLAADISVLRQTVIQLCDQMHDTLEGMSGQLAMAVGYSKGGGDFESSRKAPSCALTEKDLHRLQVACMKVHRRYKSCLLSLTKGEIPLSSDINRLMDTVENLTAKVEIATEKLPKGDPRRLPLMVFRTYSARVEVEAHQLRGWSEDLSLAQQSALENFSRTMLEGVITELAIEVEALWKGCHGTLYAVGVHLAPVLAQYALLGRALALSLKGKDPVVNKGGKLIIPRGDEKILFDDGLQELRALFMGQEFQPWSSSRMELNGLKLTPKGKGLLAQEPLGETLHLKTILDMTWYAAWRADAADLEVDEIPREIPIRAMLAELGAPVTAGEKWTKVVLPSLQTVVLPIFLQRAQEKLAKELHWVVEMGGKLHLSKPVSAIPVRLSSGNSQSFGSQSFGSQTFGRQPDLFAGYVSNEREEDAFNEADWFDCAENFDDAVNLGLPSFGSNRFVGGSFGGNSFGKRFPPSEDWAPPGKYM